MGSKIFDPETDAQTFASSVQKSEEQSRTGTPCTVLSDRLLEEEGGDAACKMGNPRFAGESMRVTAADAASGHLLDGFEAEVVGFSLRPLRRRNPDP